MKLVGKIIGIGALVILILVIGIAGYFGFVPGVSTVMGANSPKDLGVKYTQQDLQSARAKLGQQLLLLPEGLEPKASRTYSGQKPINQRFTQEELTALVNDARWRFHPVKDAQVRINDDGTVEFSGKLMKDRLEGLIESLELVGESRDQLNKGLGFFLTDPAIYAKGSLTVTNNRMILNVDSAKVGRVPIPTESFSDDQDTLNSTAESLGKNIPGLFVRSLNFQGGRMNLDGTIPAIESVSPR